MGAPYYTPFTYSRWVAITPVATPTDLLVIPHNTTTLVTIRRVQVIASQTTPAAYTLYLIQRSTANTNSVPSPPTTHSGVALDTNMPAAGSISMFNYTPANPTALGTAVRTLVTWPTYIPATGSEAVVMDFDMRKNPFIMRAGNYLALNGGGVSFGSGAALTVQVEWDQGE